MADLSDDYRRILVVTAHPDDGEFGCGATMAKWAGEGREVTLVICTNGDKGTSDRSISSAQLAEMRAVEAANAGEAMGLARVVILGYPDGFLRDTDELQEKIVRAIRTYQPDVILCQDPILRHGDFSQHRDHRVAGMVTIDSVYPSARDHLNFPEHLAEGLEPWKTAELWIIGTAEPDTWVDVTESKDKKVAALACHVSQIGDVPAMRERVLEGMRNTGKAAGLEYAEAFKVRRFRR